MDSAWINDHFGLFLSLCALSFGIVGLFMLRLAGRAIRAGRDTFGEGHIAARNICCSALTIGAGGLVWQLFRYMEENTTFVGLMIFCGVWIALFFAIAIAVDARAAARR